jgi:hypothetical protein
MAIPFQIAGSAPGIVPAVGGPVITVIAAEIPANA